MDKLKVFFIKLNFLVGLEFLFLEFLDDAFDFVIFDGHKLEFFLIEHDFRQKLVIFLFFEFLVLVDVLVFAFKPVVFLDELLVAFLELLVLVVDVLD